MKTDRTPVGKDGRLGAAAAAAQDSAELEIDRFVAAGKFKQAVELAKERHKRVNSADSERRLVEVYMGRVEQFQNKGMAQDAQTLLNLVRDRYPNQRHQLVSMDIRAAATTGRIGDLVKPLAGEQISPESRAIIETTIRQHLADLPALAATGALPAEHPLRVGAAAAWKAFEAVTSRAVTDAEIALPEISHRSPLAGWKMLVRAIAGYYRDDYAAAGRALDAIAPDAAVVRIVPMVRALIDRTKPTTGVAAVLFNRVLPDGQPLRKALSEIEASFRWQELTVLERWVKEAVRLCTIYHPDLLDRLRQHITIASINAGVPFDEVFRIVYATPKNAYFWRLLARAGRSNAPPAIAAIYWERFIRHAIDEKMFDANSVEAATVWLHIAQILAPAPLARLDQARRRLPGANFLASFYRDQPPHIARLLPASIQQLADSVLMPGAAFAQATSIRPDSQTFKEWWAWAQRVQLPVKKREELAQKWHKACPRDGQPLVLLSELAEGRKALTMALKRIGEAEAIDPLNPRVRQARLRLTLSITWRHFQNVQPNMIAKDLVELDALPGMVEGDRAAVLAAIRSAWHLMRGEKELAVESFNAVIERMGEVAGPALFDSIMMMARVPNMVQKSAASALHKAEQLEIAQAMARIIKLADDLNLKVYRPAAWDGAVESTLRLRPCPLSHAELLMLGAAAVSRKDWEQGYFASAAGLARTAAPSLTARFLLHRARCMLGVFHESRAVQCLIAALDLARQAHDQDLIDTVFSEIENNSTVRRVIDWSNSRGKRLTPEALAEIVEAERDANEFPHNKRRADEPLTDYMVIEIENSEYGLDAWSFGGAADDDDDDEDDWDDADEDEDDFDDEDEDEIDDLGLFNPPSPSRPNAKGVPPEPSFKDLESLLNQINPQSADAMQEAVKDPRKLIEAMAKALGHKVSKSDIEKLTNEVNEMMNRSGGGPPNDPPDPPWKTKRKGRKP